MLPVSISVSLDDLGARRCRRAALALAVATFLLPSLAAASATHEVLHSFSHPTRGPGKLIVGSDGMLYGLAQEGGDFGQGAVFAASPDGAAYTILHSFSRGEGSQPVGSLVEGADGRLYGMTYSTFFRVSRDGSDFRVLRTFTTAEGASPRGSLIQGPDGTFYGTTATGGASWSSPGSVFKIQPDGTGFKTLYAFTGGSDGGYPSSTLALDAQGFLYGTATWGGPSGGGTVFKVRTDGTAFSVLHAFAGDGATPWGGPVWGPGGMLYGTTSLGGRYNLGSVFRVNADGTGFATLHSFGLGDGAYPQGELVLGTDGVLYGTTQFGGPPSANGRGTVFGISADGAFLSTLHAFSYTDGATPLTGLARGADGTLYGTTYFGGLGYGTLFRVSTDGLDFATLWTPAAPEGDHTNGGLIRGSDGALYGTAMDGGLGFGTVYKINDDGSGLSILHAFDGSDGAHPHTGVVQTPDGALYGTTFGEGVLSLGSVFRINPDGTGFVLLHAFADSDGSRPGTGLLVGGDGVLYGTTTTGGASHTGTVFRIGADGSGFGVIHSFGTGDDSQPLGALLQLSDGALYGTTAGSSSPSGTVFRLATDGTGFQNLHSFAPEASPRAGLIQGAGGSLFGTTFFGGAASFGTIFRIDADGGNFATLHSFANGEPVYPDGRLSWQPTGWLYGVAGGALFRLQPDGSGFETVYRPLVEGGLGPDNLWDADGHTYGAGGGDVYRLTLDTSADLAVAVVGPTDPVPTGSPAIFTVTVTNNGPDVASGIWLTDEMGAGLDYVGGPRGCAGGNGTGTSCYLGTLAVGAHVTVGLTFSATPAVATQSTFGVFGDPLDPNSTNNTASLVTLHSGPAGQFRFEAATYTTPEAGYLNIAVVRQSGSKGGVSVHYRARSGTATLGSDFVGTAGSLFFPSGTVSRTIRIPIVPDCLSEGDETFTVELSSPTGGAVLASPTTAAVTIVDDDDPGQLQFDAASYTHVESGSAIVRVVRTPLTGVGTLACGVAAHVATSDGTAHAPADYTAVSKDILFGTGVASRTVLIPIKADATVEADEQLGLTLSLPTGGAALGAQATATLTIVNDDLPGVIEFDSATYSGKEGSTAVIQVVRRGGAAAGVTVQYGTSNGTATAGSDYSARSGTLSFAAGVTVRTFGIPILTDGTQDPGETVILSLTSPGGGAALGAQATAQVLIQ